MTMCNGFVGLSLYGREPREGAMKGRVRGCLGLLKCLVAKTASRCQDTSTKGCFDVKLDLSKVPKTMNRGGVLAPIQRAKQGTQGVQVIPRASKRHA